MNKGIKFCGEISAHQATELSLIPLLCCILGKSQSWQVNKRGLACPMDEKKAIELLNCKGSRWTVVW